MRIEVNPAILAFFDRCQANLVHDSKNSFIGRTFSPVEEAGLKRQMKKAGFAEFKGPETDWPSLYIHTQDYLASPYQSTIRLDRIIDQDFRLTRETMPAGELFSVSEILPDPKRELADWMRLRALDEPYEAAFLWQGEDVWMMDSPSEANTIDPIARKAKGNVLTFGLGIGYFIFMAMRNPEVTSITVIERSPAVIRMFKACLLPQFPKELPLTIIDGDAFDHFNEITLRRYDSIFVDIWQSNDDGFQMIERLLEQYHPKDLNLDFWIEDSCFEFLHGLIYLYFRALALKKPITHPDPFYRRLLKKIDVYFRKDSRTLNDPEDLKTLMYDRATLRAIVALRLKGD